MKRQLSGIMRFLKIRLNGASSPRIRKGKPQLPLRHRYWPLSYLVGILLCLILFSLLAHKVRNHDLLFFFRVWPTEAI